LNNKNYSHYKTLKELSRLSDDYIFQNYHFSNSFIFYFYTKNKDGDRLTLKLEAIFEKQNENSFKQNKLCFLLSNNKRRAKCKNENKIKDLKENTESIVNVLKKMKSISFYDQEAINKFSKEDIKICGIKDNSGEKEEYLEFQCLCFKIEKINESINFKELVSIAQIIGKQNSPIDFIDKIKEDLLGSCGKEILERIELMYAK